MLKKIVAVGPESTGKSTLCEQLANHFKTSWCPEYAREYLNTNGVKYTYANLMQITKGQLNLEDEYIQGASYKRQDSRGKIQETRDKKQETINKRQETSSQLTAHNSQLFFDTNLYVMKVWYEYVFGKCEQLVLDEIALRKYDLYLLCNIDLPWTQDEMREYPDEQPRIELYNMYKDVLMNQATPWVEISGDYNERLQKAIEAVEKFC